MAMSYRVVLTAEARQLLVAIQDRREQSLLVGRLEQLAENPDLQGKALRGDLAGYRSVRAVGQRYRVVYRVETELVLVAVVAVGRRKEGDRKDVYQIAQTLVQTFQLTDEVSD
jgi:mRNA interferase RelE/StbE